MLSSLHMANYCFLCSFAFLAACPKHGPVTCGHGTCNRLTGECTCHSGYIGVSCGLQLRDVARQYCNGPALIRGATLPDELSKMGDVCVAAAAAQSKDGPYKGSQRFAGECTSKSCGNGYKCVDVSVAGDKHKRFECRADHAGLSSPTELNTKATSSMQSTSEKVKLPAPAPCPSATVTTGRPNPASSNGVDMESQLNSPKPTVMQPSHGVTSNAP